MNPLLWGQPFPDNSTGRVLARLRRAKNLLSRVIPNFTDELVKRHLLAFVKNLHDILALQIRLLL